MAVNELKVKFKTNINVDIDANNKKGTIIFDVEFNYEFFKTLLETKDKFFYYSSNKKSKRKGLVFKKYSDEEMKRANKILSCNDMFKIKNIILFNIVELDNNILSNKNFNIYENIKVSNLKYFLIKNKSISNSDINNVMHNVMYYVQDYYSFWKDYSNNDFFDYTRFFSNNKKYNIKDIVSIIEKHKEVYEDFFSKILIKQKESFNLINK